MPEHDLAALWEAHCRHEFETRDVDATMATMVAAPYVNHIPTMAGGVGHDQLKRFYKYHFIGANPPDTDDDTGQPHSRRRSHRRRGDLPLHPYRDDRLDAAGHRAHGPHGRGAAGRDRAVPRRKVAHEHIYWDQASVLVQIGMLDPRGLPVAGAETARKVLDPNLPSNTLLRDAWRSSEGRPI